MIQRLFSGRHLLLVGKQKANQGIKNNLFNQNEPEILSKYYAKKYPVTEMEIMTGSDSP